MVLSKKKVLFFSIATLFIICFLFIFCGELFIRLNPKFYCEGYKLSKNNKIVYELFPNYEAKSLNAKISSQSLNDRYFLVKKSPYVYRIAVVGDSMSFGWKVGLQNSFPKVLENILNQKMSRQFEVINFSVPGYNAAQELEIIKEKVLKFNPDMVILSFCPNDLKFCNYFQPEITIKNYLYNKSYFIHFILRRIDLIITGKVNHKSVLFKTWFEFKSKILGMFYPGQIIYIYPGLEEVTYMPIDPPNTEENVPRKYWYMIGLENYKKHLFEINKLLEEKNIQFLSCGFFYHDIDIVKIHNELGVKNICDFNILREEKAIKIEDVSLLNDGHPNIPGHIIYADFLYNAVNKIIQDKN